MILLHPEASVHAIVPTAAVLAGDAATTEQIAQIRALPRLDRSVPEQFVIWLGQLLQGGLGERQRICIARAPMTEPVLLIADEAVRTLDVSAQSQVLELFEAIRSRLNLAMLFITHDLRVASQVCDTLAVKRQGRVVEYGPAHRVFGNPRHEYTHAPFAAAPGRGFAFGD